MESIETQLGQLAIARGLVTLEQLMRCMQIALSADRELTDVMIAEGMMTNADYEALVERLADVKNIRRELELGNTIVVEEIAKSRERVNETWNTPLTVEFDQSALMLDGEDRYDFKEELGRGGMGKVVLAHDQVMHRDVAVKMLLGEMENEKGRNRLLVEAQVTGLLEHPNIAPIYDLRELDSGEPFYTMRVVRERSLDQILTEMKAGEESVSLSNLMGILRQVSLAIQYAHDRGVIHRDLKPENILIGKYGEVYVIDWGIAKVVLADFGLHSTEKLVMGQLVGTPQYMAPEQARGDNDNVDARSDVYALGAVLYEILTLSPMFHADHVLSLLFQVVHQAPVPPSEQAPGRSIPSELEELCLKAVAKDPVDRVPSAQVFADELELFLEGVKERERRREMASEAIEQARQIQAVYHEVRSQYGEVVDAVSAESKKVQTWSPLSEKRELYMLEQQAKELSVEIERHFGETIAAFGQALVHMPTMPEARGALADLYWERFVEAESHGNLASAAYFEGLVRQYNDGKFDQRLEGTACLAIQSEPPGARVTLFRFEREGRRLVEWEVASFEAAAVSRTISHGSYVATLELDGFCTTRVPVLIGRSDDVACSVRLYRTAQLPGDFVVIPGGAYIRSGVAVDVKTFAIMRHPVTCGEYIEFLNESDPEIAAEHAPRIEGGDSYFPKDEEGVYALPAKDAEGDAWELTWPVLIVNYYDAVAFAAWRSQRDGVVYRLPTADEWEKAGRGVDGRIYPWGNDFDAAFCHMRESVEGRPTPAPVGSPPYDCSPYGVYDMAGNIAEWTTTLESGSERVLLKGASYNSMPVMCRLDFQMASHKQFRYSHYGFRLALTLGE